MSTDLSENALFNQGTLPDFSRITPDQVAPAVREAIRLGRLTLEQLENLENPTWDNFVLPLRQMNRRFDQVWGTVNHLLGVRNSQELREAHELVQPEIIEFQLSVSQNPRMFERWQKIRASLETANPSPARIRIADNALREARLSGVALDGEARERFNKMQQELAALATKFSNTVLDATKDFKLLLKLPAEVDGLPESWRQMAAEAAVNAGEKGANAENGPWLITLDFPSFYPFMQHGKDRGTREKIYRASSTKAGGTSSGTSFDNWPLIDKILKLRQDEAHLLGFANFADVSLDAKMAPGTREIRQMISDLAKVARPLAQQEYSRLREFAATQGLTGKLELWDIAFYSERQREQLYAYSEEELRPYFPLERVLSGMFKLAEELLGVQIAAADPHTPLWHQDVRYFEVRDEAGKQIAGFFLDPFARSSEKRGGAWMDVCRQREVDAGNTVLPIAYLICNGSPPVRGDNARPSLMTFGEVETLFHEFGHGLQHMLTRVDEYEASGISNVEWDAVELPSQFMENWVYERSVIDVISGHYQTGATLPEEKFQKIRAAKNYMSASQLLRQLYFSLLDIELHEKYDGSVPVKEIQNQIAKDYTVISPLPEDAFLCSFTHIFAGGYAAGYYSYKWAEVLSADAFAAFEEVGLENKKSLAQLGRRYRETVLAHGGSRHPMEVYRDFRGRDANIEALLRHSGLVEPAA